jgi:hypothetical protein
MMNFPVELATIEINIENPATKHKVNGDLPKK